MERIRYVPDTDLLRYPANSKEDAPNRRTSQVLGGAVTRPNIRPNRLRDKVVRRIERQRDRVLALDSAVDARREGLVRSIEELCVACSERDRAAELLAQLINRANG